MKRLLLVLALVASLFAAASTTSATPPAKAYVPSMTTDPSGGGLGICTSANYGFITGTKYGIGMVSRYNQFGTFQGYNYRYATTRWGCAYSSGATVFNSITGGVSTYSGFAWLALDVSDRVYI